MVAVLVVIGGRSATGKSTVASALAEAAQLPYLRVDRIEQAIVEWSSMTRPLGPVGYAVAHQLALEQLRLGMDVLVECVNPTAITRDEWTRTAARAGTQCVEVEVVCGDQAEHRRRVETRTSDVDGLVKPTWADVVGRDYEPWTRPVLRIDSAVISVHDAVQRISSAIAAAHDRTIMAEDPTP